MARRTFATKPEALKWEKVESARWLLTDEQRAVEDNRAWHAHHRVIEKPEWLERIEERDSKYLKFVPTPHGYNLVRVNPETEKLPTLERPRVSEGSMVVYVADHPPARPEMLELRPVSTVTLKDAMEEYRDKVVPTHKLTSQEPQRIKIRKIIRDEPHLVKKKITALTKVDFHTYRDERFQVVARSTVKGEIKLFRRVINWARDELKVDIVENPAGNIRFPSGTDVERDRRLIGDEEKRLVAKANPLLGDIIIIAADTAMREGEIVRITPGWFREFGTRRAHLRIPRETKNDTPRDVPLTRRVERILVRRSKLGGRMFPILAKTVCKKFIELRQRLAIDALCERLRLDFPTRPEIRGLYGRLELNPGTRPTIEDLCKRFEIDDLPFRDLHFHDLRHEAINRWADLGLSDIAIMKASGHKSLPAALRYRHPDIGALTERLRE